MTTTLMANAPIGQHLTIGLPEGQVFGAVFQVSVPDPISTAPDPHPGLDHIR
jgi:hypothetical protein